MLEGDSKTFVVLPVSDYLHETMLELLKVVDSVMIEYSLTTYFDNPIFHTSIALNDSLLHITSENTYDFECTHLTLRVGHKDHPIYLS